MTQQYGSTSSLSPPPLVDAQNGNDIMRTKILLLGMRRSGKTSIQEVLFQDKLPKNAFYIERTTRVSKHTYDTIIPLEIWDCPGDISLETLDAPLSQFATLIFVIDIQDLLQPPINKLVNVVITAYQENPHINLEVFVHKADALSEEYRMENFRYVQQRILDELTDISIEYDQIPINFQLTSIHDHSLHDAFSRLLQKSIESLPYLEDLLNVFCANSQSSKAFLFDIRSRLYVATDASPVDPPTHNLCSDYLLMLNAFGPLYNPQRHQPPICPRSEPVSRSSAPSTPTSLLPTSQRSHATTPAPKSPLSRSSRNSSNQGSQSQSQSASVASDSRGSSRAPSHLSKALFYPSASVALAPSATSAGVGTTIAYHLITSQLALLALIPTAVFDARRGLVEYNVVFFREGVQEICEVEEDVRGGGG
ncbi:uncharacterized protein FIBRA_00806 [Fibroporia radiculosa]|uniref:GTP-binding protein n=1 Tax=Fibroporia radiculosa TaxID=599839 RepID=J4I851_9APHY|nr:uncharacterized protein FIBRA_00806 [Fibroporia radiculosa]CCL98801.1 predicted protein [Fibroporia radiculosa]